MSKKDPNSPWINVGPKSARRKLNTQTGEELSRRQYEKKYDRLKNLGFTSFEAQAKASPKELRESRPARGRSKRTTPNTNIETYGKRLQPIRRKDRLTGKPRLWGNRVINFYFKDYQDDYDLLAQKIQEFINGLKKNKNIWAVTTKVTYATLQDDMSFKEVGFTLERGYDPSEMSSGDNQAGYNIVMGALEIIEKYTNSKSIEPIGIEFHVSFSSQYVESRKVA